MSKRFKKNKKDETLVDIVEKKEQAQDFYESNQGLILGGLLALVLVIGGVFSWNNFYKAPRQNEAVREMAQAQRMFERDSFALALDNPGGGSSGFLDIIDNYGGTAAANLCFYYSGVCYLQLGNFEAAISYLEDFSPDGTVLPIQVNSVLGNAYSEESSLKDMAKAESYYKKAVSTGGNEFLEALAMKKLGLLYESQGKVAEAKEMFEQLRNTYPNSRPGSDIEKYISRVSGN